MGAIWDAFSCDFEVQLEAENPLEMKAHADDCCVQVTNLNIILWGEVSGVSLLHNCDYKDSLMEASSELKGLALQRPQILPDCLSIKYCPDC